MGFSEFRSLRNFAMLSSITLGTALVVDIALFPAGAHARHQASLINQVKSHLYDDTVYFFIINQSGVEDKVFNRRQRSFIQTKPKTSDQLAFRTALFW